jgi:hypothetical protein
MSAESGTGLVSTLAGIAVFLALLFFAVHLLLNLYATSLVTAVAWDAVRIAAGESGTTAAAEAHARGLLGERADDVAFRWGATDDAVTLTVSASNPNLLWPGLMSAVGVEEIERTVTVRAEDFRATP